MFLLFLVQADPVWFWLGAALIALGTVFSEIAGVNYNAMLVQVSTPKTVGRVSGLGWGLGYIGGIVALVIVDRARPARLVRDVDRRTVSPTASSPSAAAVWTIIFVIPIFRNVPELDARAGARAGQLLPRATSCSPATSVRLFKEARPTFWFLIASAIYRDGLAGVFAFGAIIAAVTFEFTDNEVMLFGVAANLVAGVSTIIAGRFDDRFGARAVVLFSLAGLVVAGTIVFVLHDSGHDRVLDRGPRALRLRRTGAGGEPLAARPPLASRAARARSSVSTRRPDAPRASSRRCSGRRSSRSSASSTGACSASCS